MSALTGSRIALVVLSLGSLAAWSQQQPVRPVSQSVACAPSVPPEYLAYHALAAPQTALSERRTQAAGCAPRKGVRT